nr:hypothetical protein [Micromonospora sp. DSM 115978]
MSIRIVLAAVVTAIVVVGTGGVASAKGPFAATIDGPGLSEPLRVTPSNWGLYRLVESTGLYVTLSAAASDNPDNPDTPVDPLDPVDDRLLDTAPAGVLGPHYLVVYELPGGEDRILVEQYLYPWADGGPVASTPPVTAYG